MLVQEIQNQGTVHLLRKLLPNGNWLTGLFKSEDGKLCFVKKTTEKKWWDTVTNGGQIKNITDPNALPPNLFPAE